MNKLKLTQLLSWMLVFVIICCLTACQQEEEATINPTSVTEDLTVAIDQFKGEQALSPSSSLYGRILGPLGAKWWQWAYSLPCDRNPILDETGAFQNQNQNGSIFYLAGSGGGAVVRNVTIPYRKFIFFPIINYINTYPCPDPDFKPAPGQSLEDFLAQGAKGAIDQVDELYVELDGHVFTNLTDYRLQSRLFRFRANQDLITTNCFGDPCLTGNLQEGLTDGYWMLLAPLSRGNHKLRFRGGVSAFNFSVDVTYHINVQ